MRRPDLSRAVVLALACASLLLPASAARADMGALYDDLACRELAEIPAQFDFATSFVGLVNCARLCRDAALVCKRNVDDAAKCQIAFATDWIAFDSRIDCAGLTGSRLRDCKAGWASDKVDWLRSIRIGQFFAVNNAADGAISCVNNAKTCTDNCAVP